MLAATAPHSLASEWKTFGDQSGEPKGIIQVTEYNGILIGKIKELLEGAPSRLATRARADRRQAIE